MFVVRKLRRNSLSTPNRCRVKVSSMASSLIFGTYDGYFTRGPTPRFAFLLVCLLRFVVRQQVLRKESA